MAEHELRSFIALSKKIGRRPDDVQGGGGNTSLKLDDTRMAIKASGCLMKEMHTRRGISIVNHPAIKALCRKPMQDEADFTRNIMSCVMDFEKRPSIETGFHALLSKCVIHTHSIYANILTCAEEGPELVRALFPNALWINYTTPGQDLTLSMDKAISAHTTMPNIIFLQNHGLIVSCQSLQAAHDLYNSVHLAIRSYLDIPIMSYTPITSPNWDALDQAVLFPDQVVYTQGPPQQLHQPAAQETLWAHHIILTQIQRLKFTPHFIDADHIAVLKTMESEKYRQKRLRHAHHSSSH